MVPAASEEVANRRHRYFGRASLAWAAVRRPATVVAVASILLAAACSDDGGGDPGTAPGTATATTTTTTGAPQGATTTGAGAPPTTVTATSRAPAVTAAPGTAAPTGPVALEVTEVARDLDTVWALAFDPAGRLWFTQRNGELRQAGGPGRSIPGVVEQGEGGLMGLEIDGRGRFYLMLTTAEDNRIVRLDRLEAEPRVLVSGIRRAAIHNGGRLRLGPDGRLYAGTGDAADTSLPQRDDSLNGKVLEIDPDGGQASVFSKGHRNAQGLCFSSTGRFLSTEHGPDRGDEVNVLTRGADLGWPGSVGTGIRNWTPTIAPAGCAVYEADAIPQWRGSMLFGTLKGADLRRLSFAADGSVTAEEVLYDGELGRLRDVAVGPDGAVYLATSNRDTRGSPRPGDDRIYRVGPRR